MTTTNADSQATRLLKQLENEGRNAQVFIMSGDHDGAAPHIATVLRTISELRKRLETLGVV